MALSVVDTVPYPDAPWCPADARVFANAGLLTRTPAGGIALPQYVRTTPPIGGTAVAPWPITGIQPPDTFMPPLNASGVWKDVPVGQNLPGQMVVTRNSNTQVNISAGLALCQRASGLGGTYIVYNDASVTYTLTATVPTAGQHKLVAICVSVIDRDIAGTGTSSVTFTDVQGATGLLTGGTAPTVGTIPPGSTETHFAVIGWALIDNNAGAVRILATGGVYQQPGFNDGLAFRPVFSAANVTATTFRSVTADVWTDMNTVYTADLSQVVEVRVVPQMDCVAVFEVYGSVRSTTQAGAVVPRFMVNDAQVQLGIEIPGPVLNDTAFFRMLGRSIYWLARGPADSQAPSSSSFPYETVRPFITAETTTTFALDDTSFGTMIPGGQLILIGYPLPIG